MIEYKVGQKVKLKEELIKTLKITDFEWNSENSGTITISTKDGQLLEGTVSVEEEWLNSK